MAYETQEDVPVMFYGGSSRGQEFIVTAGTRVHPVKCGGGAIEYAVSHPVRDVRGAHYRKNDLKHYHLWVPRDSVIDA